MKHRVKVQTTIVFAVLSGLGVAVASLGNVVAQGSSRTSLVSIGSSMLAGSLAICLAEILKGQNRPAQSGEDWRSSHR